MNVFALALDFSLSADLNVHLADVSAKGGGGKEAGYMPIDVATAIPVIFWSIILFATLFFVLDRAILPRIQRTIERRIQSIDDDNEKARQATDQIEELHQSKEKVIADSKAKAKSILAEAREVSSKIQSEELSSVDEEISARISEAESRIADASEEALANLPSIAERAVGEIMSKLGVNVTKKEISEAVASVASNKVSR